MLIRKSLLTILFKPFGFLAPKDFKMIWLSNIMALSVLDEGYSRYALSGLNLISKFLFNEIASSFEAQK